MVKKILIGLLLLIVVAFGGLTYYVSSMDWNVYKQNIADKFSEATGKNIVFNGSISVSLLPQPKMAANDIVIMNSGKDKLAKIDTMNTTVDLLSLLKGKPTIKSMALEKAEIWIEQTEDGAFNWQNEKNQRLSDTLSNADLQSLTLHDTTIYYNNKAADFKFNMDNVTADIQASSITGPYKLYGTFTKESEHFGISMSLGSISSLDDIDLNFGVTHPSTNSSFKFEGSFNPDNHTITGNLSGESEKTADFVNNVVGNAILSEKDNVNFQFSLDVNSDSEIIKLTRFTVNYGGMIEGSGDITIPLKKPENDKEKQTINVKYNLISFNIKPFVSIIKAEYEEFNKNDRKYNPKFKYNADVDIAAQKIILNDSDLGYFENITFKGKLSDSIISIDEFYAAAAGNTAVSLSGSLKEEEEKPIYYIKTSIISENFLTFLNSLGLDMKSYTQSTYRNADLNMEIYGDDEEFSSENAKLTMDKMNILANIDIANFTQKDPNIKLDVNVDNIIIDNYLPKNETEGDFIKQLQADLLKLKELHKSYAEIQFNASEAIFRSTKITGLNMALTFDKDKIDIKNIHFNDIEGTTASFSGAINEINTDTPKFDNLNYDITSKNIYEMILQTNIHLPSLKILNAKIFSGKGTIDGSLDDFNIITNMIFDDSKFNYSGNIKDLTSDLSFEGKLEISSTNYGALSKNLGISLNGINNRGALNFEAEISGKPKDLTLKDIVCKLGVSTYSGNINYKHNDKTKDISGSIYSKDFDLGYIFDTQQAKSGSSASIYDNTFIAKPHFNQDKLNLQKYQNLNLNLEISGNKGTYKDIELKGIHMIITNSENVIKVQDINLTSNNLEISGNIEIDYHQITDPKTTGSLNFSNFDLSDIGGDIYKFKSGMAVADVNFSGKGDNYESILNTMSGTISLSINNLIFQGFELFAINKDIKSRQYSKGLFQVVRDNLQTGETAFKNFQTQVVMNNGIFSFIDTSLGNESMKLIATGNINIKLWQMETNFNAIPKDAEDKTFAFSLSGPINKPTLDINIESLVKHYDEYWEEVKKAEDLKLEQQRKALEEKMNSAQKKLEQQEKELLTRQSTLDEKFVNLTDPNEIKWLQDKKTWCSSRLDEINNLKLKASTPNFTEDDVKAVKEKNEEYKNDISQIDEEIKRHYAMNADISYRQYLNDVTETNKATQEKISEYKISEQNILKQIKNKSVLSDQQKEKLSTLITSFENDYSFLTQYLNDISITENIDKKYEKLNNLANHTARFKFTSSSVSESISENLKVLEDALQKEKEEREKIVQKKAQMSYENEKQHNENLLNSTIVKNKEQPKKADSTILKKLENNDVHPLNKNTNKQSTDNSGKIIKSYQEPQKEDTTKSGLLKEVNGAVAKATGTINVK